MDKIIDQLFNQLWPICRSVVVLDMINLLKF